MKASVRVWRGLKFNAKYAAKLEKKAARDKEQRAKKAAEQTDYEAEKKKRSVNPFSVCFMCSMQCA